MANHLCLAILELVDNQSKQEVQAVCYSSYMLNIKSFKAAFLAFTLTCLLSLGFALQAQGAGFRVARINGSAPVTLKNYVHWAKISSKIQAEAYDKLVAGVVAIPPGYGSCVRTVHGRGASWARAWKLCQALFLDQKSSVMSLLITSSWIQGEAKQRHIVVTRAQVKAQFNKTKKEAFSTEKEFRKFLRASGETVSDLLERIKIDLLAEAIRNDVTKGLNDSQSKEALIRFAKNFHSRWKQRTVCNRHFAIDLCGHKVS